MSTPPVAAYAYLKAIAAEYQTGRATEHSYRPALKTFLETLLPGITAINEPKRIRCGAPDYILTKGDAIIGYIEAKDIGVSLDHTESVPQLQRYLASLENLVLTDYLEFRFYRFGQKVATIRLADVLLGIRPAPDAAPALEHQLQLFADYRGESITSAKKLAEMMAAKAVLMRDVFRSAVADTEAADNTLRDQYNALKHVLIHDLTEEGFADVYAQTIAYGLFTARLHDQTKEDFSRAESITLIPSSNPFLKNLFRYVAQELDERVAWIVDALCAIYALTDLETLLRDFGRRSAQQDPILHFYETFLDAYNPRLREERGVYYTPQPVVEFIVRAIDDILQRDFGLSEGLADTSQIPLTTETTDHKGTKHPHTRSVHRVQLLDIATGTGTFLAEAVRRIHARFTGMEGAWGSYVEQHLLPRLHGFEYMMAAYAMCHLQLERLLAETGYRNTGAKRLGVYLTNSLEEYHADVDKLPIFTSWLARESIEATKIKRDSPIMIAFGNPPYSGHSANKSAWMDGLMDAYKQEPTGGKLREKNPKWLNDDYVKFIRLGEHYIAKNGEGILAYITNHGYLDNPTFRGMRHHLLQTFDDVYIVDLHGNARKKERAPDGTADDNVFNIMTGVAILIAVKKRKKGTAKKPPARVHHLDIWGKRHGKYQALAEQSLATAPMRLLPASLPECLFVPRDETLFAAYKQGFSIPDLFPVNSVGIVTARDALTIHFTKEEVQRTVTDFARLPPEEARQKYTLGADVQDWKVEWAQRDVQDGGGAITPLHYRPFDVRYTWYTGKQRGFHCRPRGEVMRHFQGDGNVGLIIGRQGQAVGGMTWNLSFICKNMQDLNVFYRGGGVVFPLYLAPDNASTDLFANPARTPNLNMQIVAAFEKILGVPFVVGE